MTQEENELFKKLRRKRDRDYMHKYRDKDRKREFRPRIKEDR